jgi:hypothetical protein
MAVPSHATTTRRDQHLAAIMEHGRIAWQRNSGNSRLSLVERAMYRYKTMRLGRPRASAKIEAAICARLTSGEGIKKVAKAVGVGNGNVARIKAAVAART